MTFDKKGKLSPRFIKPFKILQKMGDVAYELALLLDFFHVHNVFPMLRKYMRDPSHVLEFEPFQVNEDLSYDEQLVQILDKKKTSSTFKGDSVCESTIEEPFRRKSNLER